MLAIYFDTSALFRRYDDTEPGSDRVQALCHHRARNFLVIAPFTPVEMASALNRKTRDGSITPAERDRTWSLFLSHQRRRYRSTGADKETYRRAQRLLFRHPLRTVDAVHLASAMIARQWLAAITDDFMFCTADRTQAAAAAAEGLITELIA